MPLKFDERGLLPAGIHNATLHEVDQHLARFQRSDRRIKLMAKLRDYIREVQKAISGAVVLVDGSFVMTMVDEPGDIDLVLLLPANWDIDAELGIQQYNVVSKHRVRKAYEFEVFAYPSGSAKAEHWLGFFSQVRPEWRERFAWPDDVRKGLVRILP